MSKVSHKFTVTLGRPQGARVFKGTADGCRGMADALFVCGELLRAHDAFQEDVTSLKIMISPVRKAKP